MMPDGNKRNGLNPNERFNMLVQFIELGEDVVESAHKFFENKEETYPYIAIAKKDGMISKYYVCAYDCFYSFDNFTNCLDTLLKVYFVFNSKFPKKLNAILLFLQHFVYRIYTIKDKSEVATNNFINSLDKSRLPSQNKQI